MVLCRSWGRENRQDATFCLECGGRLVLTCPGCQREFRREAGFCDKRGAFLAARIVDGACGWQIVVSEVVRAVGGSLAGVEFRDAGRKELKGIPGRERVYDVVW